MKRFLVLALLALVASAAAAGPLDGIGALFNPLAPLAWEVGDIGDACLFRCCEETCVEICIMEEEPGGGFICHWQDFCECVRCCALWEL